jgi:hypothetical protein
MNADFGALQSGCKAITKVRAPVGGQWWVVVVGISEIETPKRKKLCSSESNQSGIPAGGVRVVVVVVRALRMLNRVTQRCRAIGPADQGSCIGACSEVRAAETRRSGGRRGTHAADCGRPRSDTSAAGHADVRTVSKLAGARGPDEFRLAELDLKLPVAASAGYQQDGSGLDQLCWRHDLAPDRPNPASSASSLGCTSRIPKLRVVLPELEQHSLTRSV